MGVPDTYLTSLKEGATWWRRPRRYGGKFGKRTRGSLKRGEKQIEIQIQESFMNSQSVLNSWWFKFVMDFGFCDWKSTFDFSIEKGGKVFRHCVFWDNIQSINDLSETNIHIIDILLCVQRILTTDLSPISKWASQLYLPNWCTLKFHMFTRILHSNDFENASNAF